MDNLLACVNNPNFIMFWICSSLPTHQHLEALPTVPPDVDNNVITAASATSNSMLFSHQSSPSSPLQTSSPLPTTPTVLAIVATTTSPDTPLPPLVLTLSLQLRQRGENGERMFKKNTDMMMNSFLCGSKTHNSVL